MVESVGCTCVVLTVLAFVVFVLNLSPIAVVVTFPLCSVVLSLFSEAVFLDINLLSFQRVRTRDSCHSDFAFRTRV